MHTIVATTTKNRNKRHEDTEKLLNEKRDKLRQRLNYRLEDVTVDVEPDDEGALATSSFATDLAVAALERERRELKEIEAALARIKAGEYGFCQSCANPIREVRLRALPWARLCIKCADPSLAANGD